MNAHRTVLAGGTVVTINDRDEVFAPGTVVFERGVIVYAGDSRGYKSLADDKVVDTTDKLVMPGLINAHTHSQMTHQRGIVEDLQSSEWFANVVSISGDFTADDLYWASLLGCSEMIRNGTTCIVDPCFVPGSTDVAIVHSGLRAVIAPSIADLVPGLGIQEALEVVLRRRDDGPGRITCGLGVVSADTSSSTLLDSVCEAASDLNAMIFIHAAQSLQELEAIEKRGFRGSIHYLKSLGLLGPNVIAAHCIYISEDEASLLGETNTRVVHCPASNAKIEGRIAPISLLRRNGVLLGLGTDSVASNNTMDMWEEMKWAALLGKISDGDPTAFKAREVVRMATIDNARLVGLAEVIGSLEVGKRADVVVVDTRATHLQPWIDTYSQIVYCVDGTDVSMSFVDGVPLFDRGRVLTIDEREVVTKAAAVAGRLKMDR